MVWPHPPLQRGHQLCRAPRTFPPAELSLQSPQAPQLDPREGRVSPPFTNQGPQERSVSGFSWTQSQIIGLCSTPGCERCGRKPSRPFLVDRTLLTRPGLSHSPHSRQPPPAAQADVLLSAARTLGFWPPGSCRPVTLVSYRGSCQICTQRLTLPGHTGTEK